MIIIRRTFAVKFYEEPSGREPVHDWLMELDKKDRRIIGRDIKEVQLGWPIGLPLVGSLKQGLWEVRSKLDNRIARVIFCFDEDRMLLLHGFIKKTQRTPPDDLNLAKKRYNNVLRNNRNEKK